MKILNLTQHQATSEQWEAGVFDVADAAAVKDLLTFDNLPNRAVIETRAAVLSAIAERELVQKLAQAPLDYGDELGKAARLLAVSRMDARPLFAIHGAAAMIGGAPFLMPALEKALRTKGILPVYAFSQRESVEEIMEDGTVRKTAVFKHRGFVEAV